MVFTCVAESSVKSICTKSIISENLNYFWQRDLATRILFISTAIYSNNLDYQCLLSNFYMMIFVTFLVVPLW